MLIAGSCLGFLTQWVQAGVRDCPVSRFPGMRMLLGGCIWRSTALGHALRRVSSEGAWGLRQTHRQSCLGRRRKKKQRDTHRLLPRGETWVRCGFHPGKFGLCAVQLCLNIRRDRATEQQWMEFTFCRISDEKGTTECPWSCEGQGRSKG